jgi:hypothetical protein
MPPFDAYRVRGFHSRVLADPDRLNGGLVYAITDGVSIKIGKSAGHPLVRLRDLQTGNARELQLVAYTSTMTERQAHRRFGRWRMHGEWFAAVPALLDELVTWDYLDGAALAALGRARQQIRHKEMSDD